MIQDLITEKTVMDNVICQNWEELADIAGDILVLQNSVKPQYIQAMKDVVHELGPYMVVVEGVALFHGRPEAGVNQLAMSLVILKNPVFLEKKLIKAAIVLAAVDNNSHLELMQELAGLLQDEEFLFLLRNCGSKQAVLTKIREGAHTE